MRWASCWADPVERRPPHYFEDSDGWLQVAGANPSLSPDETEGFPIQRVRLPEARSPLSLAVFVRTRPAKGPLMARIMVRSDRDSSRRMKVFWEGKVVATFDVARYFEREQPFFVQLSPPLSKGIHELRLAGGDSGRILVRQVALAGAGFSQWAEKPPLPSGGRLVVLAAYYLPDPEPPAASQVVEGRTAKQEVGLVFPGLQRFYKEHADFGAVRVVFRNPGRVPVRIADPLLFNGQSIEESYVDFQTSPGDAPGVIWYRVRPKLVAPGECGQVYIRFRKAPGNGGCSVGLPLENGRTLTALCGPDTLILAATNHIPAVKPGEPAWEPARNVILRVQLPDYLESVTAFEATEDGVFPFPCEVQDGQAQLRMDTLESGRVFLLRRRKDRGTPPSSSDHLPEDS